MEKKKISNSEISVLVCGGLIIAVAAGLGGPLNEYSSWLRTQKVYVILLNLVFALGLGVLTQTVFTSIIGWFRK